MVKTYFGISGVTTIVIATTDHIALFSCCSELRLTSQHMMYQVFHTAIASFPGCVGLGTRLLLHVLPVGIAPVVHCNSFPPSVTGDDTRNLPHVWHEALLLL